MEGGGGEWRRADLPKLYLKPVLNWANIVREHSWEYSANIFGS